MEEATFNKLLISANEYCLPKLIKFTQSKAGAEDAFMEAMYLFWKDLNAGKIKHLENPHGLIYVMAKNWWLMAKRKAKRGKVQEYATDPTEFRLLEGRGLNIQEEEDYNLLLKSENEQSELKERLRRELAFTQAFKKLSEKCRQLLTKFIVEKVRLKELQEVLGYPSADAVKMAKYRCKKNLAKVFKEEITTE